MMTKRHFIALADAIRLHNKTEPNPFTDDQLNTLVRFCYWQNGAFKRGRWLAYIAGECGPSGGKLSFSERLAAKPLRDPETF